MVTCPGCEQTLYPTDSMVGEIVECTGCSAELEVLTVDPLRLALAPEVEEDWGE